MPEPAITFSYSEINFHPEFVLLEQRAGADPRSTRLRSSLFFMPLTSVPLFFVCEDFSYRSAENSSRIGFVPFSFGRGGHRLLLDLEWRKLPFVSL